MTVVKKQKSLQVSYSNLIRFNNLSAQYLKGHNRETELKAAITDALEQFKTHFDSFNQKREKLNRRFCNKDEHGSMLFTSDPKTGIRTYKFTEEGDEQLEKAFTELLEEKVAITPYSCGSMPELDKHYLEIFTEVGLIDKDTKPLEDKKEEEIAV